MSTPALDSVEKLRRIAAAIEDGRAPDPGDGAWLAARLREYFEGVERGLETIDQVLGVAPAPGGVSWVEAERRDRRDALLCTMAKRHFPGQRPGPAAKKILAAWSRYERCRLDLDRRRGATDAAPGMIDADLFKLARLYGPPGWRRLRDVLANAEQSAAA